MKQGKLVILSAVSILFSITIGATSASADPSNFSGEVVKVAVIGDSYSAGNGAGIYVNDNHDGAYHSANNWGHVYVDWLNEQGVNALLVAMLAYSGSVTDDLLCAQTGTHRSQYSYNSEQCELTDKEKEDNNPGNQITRIPDDTDIVLLTIGGNDVHFSDIVKKCFTAGMRDPKTCENQVSKANDNLRESVNYNDDLGEQVSVQKKTETVLKTLDATLKPGAEVVLIGYPLLSTTRPYVLAHDEVYSDGRPAGTTKYPAGIRVRDLGQEATQVQQELVNNWNSQRNTHIKVRYVSSIADAFAGHEPDPSATSKNSKRWINEFFETRTREINGHTISAIDFDYNNFYHPGITGHEKIAQEIENTIGIPSSVRSVHRGSTSQELLDVAIVVDSTGSMEYVNTHLGAIAHQAMLDASSHALSVRFAVVSYRDYPGYADTYDSCTNTDFTTNPHRIEESFQGISGIEHLKDNAQSTVFSGVNEALQLDWRPDAHKNIIVIGDAGAREMENHTGYNADRIAQLTTDTGGVVINAIDTHTLTTSYGPSLSESTMAHLAETTGGHISTASTVNDIYTMINESITEALTNPSAWLHGPIYGYINNNVVFDARGSYSVNGRIVKYDWDTNGDNIYEHTTTTGILTHTFNTPITATARVRITDEKGRTAIATTPLHITAQPDSLPDIFPSQPQDKPGIYEILDEEATQQFPELAQTPLSKDAVSPYPKPSASSSSPARLPQTGAPINTTITLAIFTIMAGAIFIVIRKYSTK